MRRCKDAKMRRGFEKILTAEDAKMQRCDAAERVWEHLDSRRCKDAKMRCCGEGLRTSWQPKMRRCKDAMLRQPTKYLQAQCHEDAKMRCCEDARHRLCPPSATVLFQPCNQINNRGQYTFKCLFSGHTTYFKIILPFTCFCDEQSVSLSFITTVWW